MHVLLSLSLSLSLSLPPSLSLSPSLSPSPSLSLPLSLSLSLSPSPPYRVVDTTIGGQSANINSGSLFASPIYLCYRQGRDKPPIVEIG